MAVGVRLGALIAAAFMPACDGTASSIPATPMSGTAVAPSSQARARETLLYSFGGIDGSGPINGVISDNAGGFYGTTVFGGRTGVGTIFRLKQSASGYTESVLYNFASGTNGQSPEGITERQGAFYGVTLGGGSGGWGTVFKLSHAHHAYRESVLYRFQGSPDGAEPLGPIVLDRNGNIYGVTASGGAHNQGAIFKLSPAGSQYTESVLYSFPGGAAGGVPEAGVTIDRHGTIYGTTMYGGSYGSHCGSGGCGTVFKVAQTASGYSESVAYAFQGLDGNLPYGVPTLDDRTGTIYGTTFWGGTQRIGVVYKLTPHGSSYSATALHSFTGGADGSFPEGQLLLEPDGTLYGTATSGGGGCRGIGCGTVYELKPAQKGYKFRTLIDFRNPRRGAEPEQTNILQDASGALYGTTRSGGTQTGCSNGGPGGVLGCGVVFKIAQ